MNWFQKLLAKFFPPKPKIEWKSEDYTHVAKNEDPDDQLKKLNGQL